MADEQELQLVVSLVDDATPGLLKLKGALQETANTGMEKFKRDVEDIEKKSRSVGEHTGRIVGGINEASKSLAKFSSQVSGLPIAEFTKLSGEAGRGVGGFAIALGSIPPIIYELNQSVKEFAERMTSLDVKSKSLGVQAGEFRALADQIEHMTGNADEANRTVSNLLTSLARMRPGQREFIEIFQGEHFRGFNPDAVARQMERIRRLDPADQIKESIRFLQETEKRALATRKDLTPEDITDRMNRMAQRLFNIGPDWRNINWEGLHKATQKEIDDANEKIKRAREDAAAQDDLTKAIRNATEQFHLLVDPYLTALNKQLAKFIEENPFAALAVAVSPVVSSLGEWGIRILEAVAAFKLLTGRISVVGGAGGGVAGAGIFGRLFGPVAAATMASIIGYEIAKQLKETLDKTTPPPLTPEEKAAQEKKATEEATKPPAKIHEEITADLEQQARERAERRRLRQEQARAAKEAAIGPPSPEASAAFQARMAEAAAAQEASEKARADLLAGNARSYADVVRERAEKHQEDLDARRKAADEAPSFFQRLFGGPGKPIKFAEGNFGGGGTPSSAGIDEYLSRMADPGARGEVEDRRKLTERQNVLVDENTEQLKRLNDWLLEHEGGLGGGVKGKGLGPGGAFAPGGEFGTAAGPLGGGGGGGFGGGSVTEPSRTGGGVGGGAVPGGEFGPGAGPAPKGPYTGSTGTANVNSAIEQAAKATGLSPTMLKGVASIESSMDPGSNRNRATQYKGLFQIGREEWGKYGSGDIYNAGDNAMAAARMLKDHAAWFKNKFGHDPTPGELYMMHQQGRGFFTKGTLTNVGGNPYPGMSGPQTTASFGAGWNRELQRRMARFGTPGGIYGGGGGGAEAAATPAGSDLAPGSGPGPKSAGNLAEQAGVGDIGGGLRFAKAGETWHGGSQVGHGSMGPQKLQDILKYAGRQAGVDTLITAGIEGGHHRHLLEQSGGLGSHDVTLRAPDGHILNFRNPQDRARMQQYISAAASAGATGIGVGEGYMGTTGIHVGGGTPAVWGAKGSGAKAPDWLRSAYERGRSGAGGGDFGGGGFSPGGGGFGAIAQGFGGGGGGGGGGGLGGMLGGGGGGLGGMLGGGGGGLGGMLGGGGFGSILGMIGGGRLGGLGGILGGLLGGGGGIFGLLASLFGGMGGGGGGGLGGLFGGLFGGGAQAAGAAPGGATPGIPADVPLPRPRAGMIDNPPLPQPRPVPLPRARPGDPWSRATDQTGGMLDPWGEQMMDMSGADRPGMSLTDMFDRGTLDRSALSRNAAAMTHRVHGTGKLDVNVNAPPNTQVKAEGGGIFRQLSLNRQTQMGLARGGPIAPAQGILT